MSTSTTLTTIASLQNDPSATTDLNNNFAAINTAMAGALSLTGQSPNQMQANLDMNSNQIINLPTPSTSSSPIRVQDLVTTALLKTSTFALLPVASSNKGLLAVVTDSTTNTWGATITGSGAFTVLAWSNGTNWTVIGK